MTGTAAVKCQVVLATSHDEKHGPEHAVSESGSEYWSTTGCYPQELCVRLDAAVDTGANVEVRTAGGARSPRGRPICDAAAPSGTAQREGGSQGPPMHEAGARSRSQIDDRPRVS